MSARWALLLAPGCAWIPPAEHFADPEPVRSPPPPSTTGSTGGSFAPTDSGVAPCVPEDRTFNIGIVPVYLPETLCPGGTDTVVVDANVDSLVISFTDPDPCGPITLDVESGGTTVFSGVLCGDLTYAAAGASVTLVISTTATEATSYTLSLRRS